MWFNPRVGKIPVEEEMAAHSSILTWFHGQMSLAVYSPWNSPSQNTTVGSSSLLQGIFPTQGSNPGVWHCKWILYQLSHQGSH